MENIENLDAVVPKKTGKTIWLVLWALIGLGLSIKLTMIYYTVNFVPNAMPSFCAINDVIDCDAVAGTRYAQMLGVPLACFGLFLYSFIIFMCFVDKLKNIKFLSFLEVFKNKFAYIFTIYLISFGVSIYLTGVQFFEIQKFCLLCFITYLVDFVSLFIAKDYSKPIYYEVKTSIVDFCEAIKIKKYLIAFIAVILCVAGLFSYTKFSYIFTPGMKRVDSLERFQKMKGNPFDVHGNTLGNPDGDVIIYEHSDFECPMCPIMNRMLQKATTEFENIYVIHYNFPMDNACNPVINRPFHQNACRFAKYAIAAKKQDKYWEMINLLFDKKPKTWDEFYKKVEKIGIDPNQLANDYAKAETADELEHEIMTALKKGMEPATPTIFINGEKYVGIMTYDELKENLIKSGAVLKNK